MTLGVGYGFRTDFLAAIPPFFVTVFGFLEGGLLKNVRLKAAAAAVCVVVFLYELTLRGAALDVFVQQWGAVPRRVLPALTLDSRVPHEAGSTSTS